MTTDFTKGDLTKHIKQIAIPASVGFFFHTMYNVVDTWFAAKYLSTEAAAALAISFPVFFIIIALSGGIGNGVSALVTNALGEKHTRSIVHIQNIK